MLTNRPTPPSHTLFYWKPWKENANLIDSWLDYNKDISLINYSADSIGQYVQQASNQQIEAIGNLGDNLGLKIENVSSVVEDSIKSLNDTFESGINYLLNSLDNINEEMSLLNGSMELQIEQQKITNLLLEDLNEVMRLPDSEKERNHCIELGLKFFANASKDPDLFDDALKEFSKAEKLMEQDYFVLHRIGMIYTYSTQHIDITKALNYFIKAAKYASVESDPDAILLANILRNKGNHELTSLENDKDSIGFLAADSYEKAAFSSYILGDFESAIKLQTKSLNFDKNASRYFMLAKYQCRTNLISDSISNLDTSLDLSPDLIYAVLKDLDLSGEQKILDFLQNKNQLILEKINLIISQLQNCSDSKYDAEINKLIQIKSGNYLAGAKFIFNYNQEMKKLEGLVSDLKIKINSPFENEINLSNSDPYSLLGDDLIYKFDSDKKLEINDAELSNLMFELESFGSKPLYLLLDIFHKAEGIFNSEKDSLKKTLEISYLDSLIWDAARLIVTSQSGSTSLLQRRMQLGYNRAGRLMYQLEILGIVGKNQGDRVRDVLIKSEKELDQLLSDCYDGITWNPKLKKPFVDSSKTKSETKHEIYMPKPSNTKKSDNASSISNHQETDPGVVLGKLIAKNKKNLFIIIISILIYLYLKR